MVNNLYRAKQVAVRGNEDSVGEWTEGQLIVDYYRPGDNPYRYKLQPYLGYLWAPPIDPETLCQPTGVFDSDNQEIFTNDIVSGLFSFGMPINGVASFQKGSFGLTWYRGEVEEFTPFTSMCNIELKILGNKFDNPELLEQENLQPSLSR